MFVICVQSKSIKLNLTHAGSVLLVFLNLSARDLISPYLYNEILGMSTTSDQLSRAFTVNLCLESIGITIACTVSAFGRWALHLMLLGGATYCTSVCLSLWIQTWILNFTPGPLKRMLLVEVKFAFIVDLLTSHLCLKVLSLISLKRGHLLQFMSLSSCIYRKIQVKKMQQ